MLSSLPAGSNVLIQGASRGIGLEFARQLLAEPQVDRIFAACRSPQSATTLTNLAAREPRLRVLALDAANEDSIRAASAAYERLASDLDGRVWATLEIIWMSGWAPHESQQKPLKPGSAEISLTKVLKTTN